MSSMSADPISAEFAGELTRAGLAMEAVGLAAALAAIDVEGDHKPSCDRVLGGGAICPWAPRAQRQRAADGASEGAYKPRRAEIADRPWVVTMTTTNCGSRPESSIDLGSA